MSKEKQYNITLKDVSERAGVSPSAVSRTFTEGASVSAKTRKKVENAALELNYSPNFLARSLTTKRTKLIGLISDNYSNPIFLEVFDLFTKMLQEKGFRPLLYNYSQETNVADAIKMLKQYNVDGVIIASSTVSPEFIEGLKYISCPIVHTFGHYDDDSNINVVGPDNVHGGKLAARILIEKKCQNIIFLGGPEQASSTQDRLKGFEHTLALHDIKIKKLLFCAHYSYDSGKYYMDHFLEKNTLKDIDAVFCGDDLICMGAIDAAYMHGYNIPQDVGFLGFNDIFMGSWGRFKLTTIHQPIKQITSESVDLILSLLENPHQPTQTRLFPCKTVMRDSL